MFKYDIEYVKDNFGEVFLNDEPINIYNLCIKEFREMITLREFEELVESFNQGVQYYYLEEKSYLNGNMHFIWIDDKNEKIISVVFDNLRNIHRIIVKNYVKFPETDNLETDISYTMPIEEQWTVIWGGKNEFLNYHYLHEPQRYAYDLVIMNDECTFENNSIKNENFYAFNKNIISPAEGKVREIVNDIHDNIPGEMNETDPFGNYVIIEHAENEYSLIAHFKQFTIIVKEGEYIEKGQQLGLCGNSGNSSEPHIHFQVMDSPDLYNCCSLPIRFSNGTKPIQGDYVAQSLNINENNLEENRMDKWDKTEVTLSLLDYILMIPRFIGQFLK
ncbi:M23 family metallopeptidase [Salinicoccus kekensis]|uniref:lysostaphin n=1 Tax=Salinicoccus kekensis TaxID=714307 RepID=A0A285UQ34_9STAP|nr:M23 family metallopeptidase [Salinicoccus kekensis]SOC43942.1 peptidase M23-like protein [Salinicoccus kekensis]